MPHEDNLYEREGDPLRPPLPRRKIPGQFRPKPIDKPIGADPSQDHDDPVRQIARYVNQDWFQQLVPVRTSCYRCHRSSDVVFVPLGTLCFNDPRLKRGNVRDITLDVIDAFNEIGWKFQLRKSYCPDCKGLGGI